MSAIAKAKAKGKTKDDRLSENKTVRDTLKMVKGTEDGMPALEITLMELALMDLHRKREQIEKGARKRAGKRETADVKKLYRAIAKTGLKDPERAMAILKHLGGEDGEEPHPSGSSQDVHSGGEGDDKSDDSKEMPSEAESRAERARQQAESATDQIFDIVENDKIRGAMSSFLTENTIGQGIIAVADFFSQTQSKLQFAAKAIAEFGPIAGVRLAHTYFRYGGYDVPVTAKGKTQMGDKLPTAENASKTRDWAIKTLQKRLPSNAANNAGAEPPSEGFIIDKDGNVIAHGVGRGNDHFLPFNTRHLKRIRQSEGSEYVRRRMFGGPTTEDLHAAMMMGADRVTVVSNGGVFSISLTQRAHGLKMEHMQVLSRYQDILDDRKGRLNFSGYNSALDALESEFPLHFQKVNATGGDWADMNDRIGPKAKFMDQLRDLFDVMGGDDPRSRNTQMMRDEQGRVRLPNMRSGDTTRDWAQRQVSSGQDLDTVIGQLERFYQSQGTTPNNVRLVQELKQRRQREQQRSGAPSWTSQSQRENSSVRTPQNSGDSWRDVETRTADVSDFAVERARAVQPPGNTSGMMNATQRVRIKQLAGEYGFDLSDANPSEAKTLNELASIAESDDAWADLMADRSRQSEYLGRIFYGTD